MLRIFAAPRWAWMRLVVLPLVGTSASPVALCHASHDPGVAEIALEGADLMAVVDYVGPEEAPDGRTPWARWSRLEPPTVELPASNPARTYRTPDLVPKRTPSARYWW
jgi:hypothetical protein